VLVERAHDVRAAALRSASAWRASFTRNATSRTPQPCRSRCHFKKSASGPALRLGAEVDAALADDVRAAAAHAGFFVGIEAAGHAVFVDEEIAPLVGVVDDELDVIDAF